MIKSLILFFAFIAHLQAAPEGFHLVAGEAKPPSVDANGTMTIESGKQAVIHWDRFSIQKDQTVRFAQQDASSAVLNRVTGLSQSQIDGLLFSNGKIYLVNPNGILIGPNGRIEAAAFIGSTLDLLNEDFLKGREMTFRGSSNKAIVNLGEIRSFAGDVFLIGRYAKNLGTLTADQGIAQTACGQEIVIRPGGRERIFIRVPSESLQTVTDELQSGESLYQSSQKEESLTVVKKEQKTYLASRSKPRTLNAGGYTIFFKQVGATPVPPDAVQVAIAANTIANTTITNILSPPTSDSNSSVILGPPPEGDTNPLAEDPHSVPYNNNEQAGGCQ